MSLIINQSEAQLRKVSFGYFNHFAYQTKRTKHRIMYLVIYDPKKKEVVIKGDFEEVLKEADVDITSLGSTKNIVKKRTLDLGNKDMFVYDSSKKGFLANEYNMVDLYIPTTYFSDFEVSSYLESATGVKDTVQIYQSTAVHLYFKDEGDNTIKLGSVIKKELKKIRSWFSEDVRMFLQKKRQLFEQEEKELLQLCKEKADESKFVDFKDRWEEKYGRFDLKHSSNLFDYIPFVE